MRLTKIRLQNYRCFEDLEVSLSNPLPAPWNNLTVLVAANGHGKTAVLEAIRYLLGVFVSRLGVPAPKPRKTDIRQIWPEDRQSQLFDGVYMPPRKAVTAPYMRLAVTGKWDKDKVQWDTTLKRDNDSMTSGRIPPALGSKDILPYADSMIRNNNNGIPQLLPVFAYFGTERAVIRGLPQRQRGFQKVFKTFDAYAGAMAGNLDYRKMIEWMVSLDYEQLKRRDKTKSFDYVSIEHKAIQLAVERMLPGFSNLRVEKEKNEPLDLKVDIQEEKDFRTCRIDSQLSDGQKIVLVLVLNLVSRILEANSGYPEMTAETLLETEGIVLIDELELHLHPSWQQRILPDLLRTFPNIQFIVTTHSPQVVSSVPKECIRIIKDGKLVPFDIQTEGAKAGQVLNEIFGTDSRAPKSKVTQAFNEYYALIQKNQWDSPRGVELKEFLSETLSSDPDFMALATEIHIRDYQRRHAL